jgi:hypothetical protein
VRSIRIVVLRRSVVGFIRIVLLRGSIVRSIRIVILRGSIVRSKVVVLRGCSMRSDSEVEGLLSWSELALHI